MADHISGHLTTIFSVIGGFFTLVGFLLLRSPRSVFSLQVGKKSRTNRQGRILIFTYQLSNGYRGPGRDLTEAEQTILATEILALIKTEDREAGEAKKLAENVDAWRTWWASLLKRAGKKVQPKGALKTASWWFNAAKDGTMATMVSKMIPTTGFLHRRQRPAAGQ